MKNNIIIIGIALSCALVSACSLQKDCSDYIETYSKNGKVNEVFYSSVKKSCVVYYETKLKVFVDDAGRKKNILNARSAEGCKVFNDATTEKFDECMFAIDELEKEMEKLK